MYAIRSYYVKTLRPLHFFLEDAVLSFKLQRYTQKVDLVARIVDVILRCNVITQMAPQTQQGIAVNRTASYNFV